VQAGASGARLALLRDVVEHRDRLPARDDLQRRLGAHEAEAALRGRARSWPPPPQACMLGVPTEHCHGARWLSRHGAVRAACPSSPPLSPSDNRG